MKLLFRSMVAVLSAGALTVTTFAAQNQSAQQQLPGQKEPQRAGGLLLQQGFIKKGDKVFKVERVTKATKLEGLEVDEHGNIMKDGKRIELKDGQQVNPQGQVSAAP